MGTDPFFPRSGPGAKGSVPITGRTEAWSGEDEESEGVCPLGGLAEDEGWLVVRESGHGERPKWH